MSKYLIAHHLGMGDHIILNGLVRHIYNIERHHHEEVWLLCYEHNARNVSRMYDDIHIKLLLIPFDQTKIGEVIQRFREEGGRVEDLHLVNEEKGRYSEIGDEAFFYNHGYNIELLTQFKIQRNYEREYEVYSKLTDCSLNYIFIHDDIERGYEIDKRHLPIGDYKIVRASKDIPMFDLLLLMERAKECHVISSSFLCIGIASKMKNMTAHLYMRNDYLNNYIKKYGIKTIV